MAETTLNMVRAQQQTSAAPVQAFTGRPPSQIGKALLRVMGYPKDRTQTLVPGVMITAYMDTNIVVLDGVAPLSDQMRAALIADGYAYRYGMVRTGDGRWETVAELGFPGFEVQKPLGFTYGNRRYMYSGITEGPFRVFAGQHDEVAALLLAVPEALDRYLDHKEVEDPSERTYQKLRLAARARLAGTGKHTVRAFYEREGITPPALEERVDWALRLCVREDEARLFTDLVDIHRSGGLPDHVLAEKAAQTRRRPEHPAHQYPPDIWEVLWFVVDW